MYICYVYIYIFIYLLIENQISILINKLLNFKFTLASYIFKLKDIQYLITNGVRVMNVTMYACVSVSRTLMRT